MSGDSFVDGFGGSTLDTRWSTAQINDGGYSVAGGNLVATIGSNLIANPNDISTYLTGAPSGDFTATMKATFDGSSLGANEGLPNVGIGLFSEDLSTFVKVDYEVDTYGWDSWPTREGGSTGDRCGVRVLGGAVTDLNDLFGAPFTGHTVNFGGSAFYLRLTRVSGVYSFAFSANGTNFSSIDLGTRDFSVYSPEYLGMTFYGGNTHTQPNAFVDSFTLQTAPDAPSGLSAAMAGTSEIDLSWADNSTDETGFVVQYSPDPYFAPENTTTLDTLPANSASASVTGLTDNTQYYFRVQAVGPEGIASAYSDSASDWTKPLPPTDLTASYTYNTHIDLNWANHASGSYQNVISYWCTIETPQGDGTQVPLSGDATSWIMDVPDGVVYQYSVEAVAVGGSGYLSDPVWTAGMTPKIVPTNLQATGVSSTEIDLSWENTSSTAATDFYDIQRYSEGEGWVSMGGWEFHSLTFADDSVTEGQVYTYQVRASNVLMPSDWSDPISVSTQFLVDSVGDAEAADAEASPFTGAVIDDGQGNYMAEVTLRSFIEYANATEGAQEADFAIPTSEMTDGQWVISAGDILPTITDTLAIVGVTDDGAPLIVLSGSGLHFQADDSSISGLEIDGYGDIPLSFTDCSDASTNGCVLYSTIPVDADFLLNNAGTGNHSGLSIDGEGLGIGIKIVNGSAQTISGCTIISCFTAVQIDNADHNVVRNNGIVSNTRTGVLVTGALSSDNEIRDNCGGLSGILDNPYGVVIADGAHDNKVLHNDILNTQPNQLESIGVEIRSGAHGNYIGLIDLPNNQASNLFGGHTTAVRITDTTYGNHILGNWIGILRNGTMGLGGVTGVEVLGSSFNEIIGNKIAGLSERGVYIEDGNATTVSYNTFGVTPAPQYHTGVIMSSAVNIRSGSDNTVDFNIVGDVRTGVVVNGDNNFIVRNEVSSWSLILNTGVFLGITAQGTNVWSNLITNCGIGVDIRSDPAGPANVIGGLGNRLYRGVPIISANTISNCGTGIEVTNPPVAPGLPGNNSDLENNIFDLCGVNRRYNGLVML